VQRDAEDLSQCRRPAGVSTATATYPLGEANRALPDLRNGALQGAAVLVP
jgi:propanol-preferring alcohol dehydrogenase